MFLWKKAVLAVLVVTVVGQQLTSGDTSINVPQGDDRILVEVYSESLCPYCHKFISGPLRKALETKDIWKIARFRMIPFGNGKIDKEGGSYSFSCQHGEEECQGNIIETCAFELYSEPVAWQYILCLEQTDKQWKQDGKACADSLKLNWEMIRQCTNSNFGRERQFFAGLETQYIDSHSVPHVRANGHVDDSGLLRKDPLQFVCLNYADFPAIEACQPYFEQAQ